MFEIILIFIFSCPATFNFGEIMNTAMPHPTLSIGGNIAHALPLFEADFADALGAQGVSVQVAASQLLEHAALVGSAHLLDDDFWGKVSAYLPRI